MALNFLQYYNLPPAAQRSVYPMMSFGWYNLGTIAPGTSEVIPEGPLGALPISNDWSVAVNYLLDAAIWITSSTTAPNCSLIITSSIDGGGFVILDSLLIAASGNSAGMPTRIHGYPLPPWNCKFSVHNPSAATPVTVRAILKVRAM